VNGSSYNYCKIFLLLGDACVPNIEQSGYGQNLNNSHYIFFDLLAGLLVSILETVQVGLFE